MIRKNRCSKLLIGLLSMCMAFQLAPVQSMAAEAETPYTYTVRFYAGNHGAFTGGEQVSVYGGGDYHVSAGGDMITVSNLSAGARVSLQAQDAVSLEEGSKYYVRGVRRSGYDNDTVGTPSSSIDSDQDYVVAYGIRGELVAYRVQYHDEAGNDLSPERTYHGNLGDYTIVGSLNIDGYRPNAYNLGKTLVSNEEENVFEFIYTPVTADEGGTGGGGTGEGTGGGTEGGGTPAPAPGTEGAAGAPAPGAAGAGGAAGGAAAGDGAAGGAAGTEVPDEEVPQADEPEELVNLDDEEVPQAGTPDDSEAEETAGNTRSIAGAVAIAVVGAAALIGLLILWLKKRKKDEEERESEE